MALAGGAAGACSSSQPPTETTGVPGAGSGSGSGSGSGGVTTPDGGANGDATAEGAAPEAGGDTSTDGTVPVEAGPDATELPDVYGGIDVNSLPDTSGLDVDVGCNLLSCPSGCCDMNAVCQAGTSNTQCGTQGIACADCTQNGQTCVNNACQ
jgi:hypothetical protein